MKLSRMRKERQSLPSPDEELGSDLDEVSDGSADDGGAVWSRSQPSSTNISAGNIGVGKYRKVYRQKVTSARHGGLLVTNNNTFELWLQDSWKCDLVDVVLRFNCELQLGEKLQPGTWVTVRVEDKPELAQVLSCCGPPGELTVRLDSDVQQLQVPCSDVIVTQEYLFPTCTAFFEF
jgi:hypothetical protein